MRVEVPVLGFGSTLLSEVLCLVVAGEQYPSHYLGLRPAIAVRPDRLTVPAADSHPAYAGLSTQADAGAVSADWLLLLPFDRPPGVCR